MNGSQKNMSPLDFSSFRNRKICYSSTKMCSSRSYSKNAKIEIQNQQSFNQSKKSSRTANSSSYRKTTHKLQIPSKLAQSINLLKLRKLTPQLNSIKKACLDILQMQPGSNKTRQNKIKLVDILLQVHPFFTKINTSITQAIVLLGKLKIYNPQQLIFSTSQQKYVNNTENCAKYKQRSKQNGKKPNKDSRKQQIGFILYGNILICNDKLFYSHRMVNNGSLFEDKLLVNFNNKKMEYAQYYASVMSPCCVIWLSKQSYYIIRKQCFLSLDLKYKFGQFQNMLKFSMIDKKLPKANQIIKINQII